LFAMRALCLVENRHYRPTDFSCIALLVEKVPHCRPIRTVSNIH